MKQILMTFLKFVLELCLKIEFPRVKEATFGPSSHNGLVIHYFNLVIRGRGFVIHCLNLVIHCPDLVIRSHTKNPAASHQGSRRGQADLAKHFLFPSRNLRGHINNHVFLAADDFAFAEFDQDVPGVNVEFLGGTLGVKREAGVDARVAEGQAVFCNFLRGLEDRG